MKISICLPYWKRQAQLDGMFENYASQYPDLDLEFSVCDDGSPVPAVVPEGCILTRLPTKDKALNPCVPINRAVAASTGEMIVLTNPEIEHRTPILHEMLGLFEGLDDYVMASCQDTRAKQTWVAGPKVDYRGGGREAVPKGGHFHFLVMLYRSLWLRAGGFDEDYRQGQACDDNDWLWRLCSIGAHFKVTMGAVFHHPSNITWRIPHNRPLFLRKWPKERRSKLQ